MTTPLDIARSSSPWPPVVTLLITLAVFVPACGFEFVRWDDPANVYNNPDLNPVTAASVASYWAAPYRNMYIPVTYTAWAGLATVARTHGEDGVSWVLNPYVFHAANVAVHAGTVLVTYVVLRRLLAGRGNSVAPDWAACAGAVVFAIHPLQVEPVAWVSGFRDVLSGLFAVVAIWMYVEYADVAGAGRRRLAYAGAVAAFGMSVLAKPAVIPLPLALAAIDRLILGRAWRDVARSAGGLLLVSVAAAILTAWSQPAAEVEPAALWARPIVMLDAVAFYVTKLFAPLELGLDYGRTPQWVLSSTAACVGSAAVVGVAIAVIVAARRRWLAAGAIVFVAMLLPVSGLVTFDHQRHSTVADRYAYLPMLGVAVAVAFAVRARPTRGVAGVTALLIICLGVRAAAQVRTWRDSNALFANALAVNPTSLAAAAGLAEMDIDAGRYVEAADRLRGALTAHPDDTILHYDLGNALLLSGHPGDAVPHYREALKRRQDAFLYTNLVTALARSGRADEALVCCRGGIAHWPANPQLHFLAGVLLGAKGDPVGAAVEYAEAVRVDPAFGPAKSALAELARRPATRPVP